LIEPNQILQGDCLEILQTFPDNCIDLTVTSPPYNMRTRISKGKYIKREISDGFSKKYQFFDDALPIDEFYFFHKEVIAQLLRVSKLIFYNFQVVTGSKEAYFKLMGDYAHVIKDIIIWDKGFGQPSMHEKVLNAAFEIILVMENDTLKGRVIQNAKFERGTLSNVWRIGRPNNNPYKEHGAVFPESLCNTILKNFSSEGDIVLDPFAGTGTLLIEAERMNRKWVGIEIVPEYAQLIQSRIDELANTQKSLLF